MRYAGVVGLGAAVSIIMAGAAMAQSTSSIDGQRQTVVRIPDLNTATAAGAATLRTRLQTAAQTVCGPRPQNPVDLAAAARFRTCVRETFTAALATAPSAQLMAASGEIVSRR